MDLIIFYTLATVMVLASLLVVGQRNPMYSVLLLIASFGALSGLYIQLDAPFVAVAQIIIYAGAIMVLFLFVVMLLNAPQEDAAEWYQLHPFRQRGVARFGALLFEDFSKLADVGLPSALGTAYTVLLAFAWAHWAWIKLATSMSVTVFSLCMLLTPVVGVFSGMLFLGERPGWPEYTALVFVLGSLATVIVPNKRRA